MIAALYAALNLFAVAGFVVAIGGHLNDSNNRYPLPLLLAAAAAFVAAQWLLPG